MLKSGEFHSISEIATMMNYSRKYYFSVKLGIIASNNSGTDVTITDTKKTINSAINSGVY